MAQDTIHVALMKFHIFIPFSNSLKAKRGIIKSLKDKIRNRFNASVAEVGDLDKWQSAIIAVAFVGNDKNRLMGEKDRLINFIDTFHEIEMTDQEVEYL